MPEHAGQNLSDLLERYGFDREQHEQIRADLKNGRTGPFAEPPPDGDHDS